MPLTQPQQTELKGLLQQRRSTLVAEIRAELARSDNEHYVDLAGRVADSGEASVADMLVDLDAAMTDRDVRELREVEAALVRIADGSYGECTDCGGEVEYARLKANPAATRCIRCQTRHEQAAGRGSTPKL